MFYRIKRGVFYGKELAGAKMAMDLLSSLKLTPVAMDSRVEPDLREHISKYKPEVEYALSTNGEMSSWSTVHELLTHALTNSQSYWLEKYAFDTDVTSDATCIKWQEIEIRITIDDRTVFDGLWLWEVRRTAESRFQLRVRRLFGKEWETSHKGRESAVRIPTSHCPVCAKKLGLLGEFLGRSTHRTCKLVLNVHDRPPRTV